MTRHAAHIEVDRPLLRGICLIVKGNRRRRGEGQPPLPPVTAAKFPRRPEAGALSESIPLFFIGRNENGFWLAREAEGRTGGIFLFKRSALRFAKKNSAPVGCATMLLADRFELDVENRGNPLVAWLYTALRSAVRLLQNSFRFLIPAAAVAMERKPDKGERP